MGEFPKFVTKYFELKDWHYFESGQIKFGTLEEYRSAENMDVMGARLDATEGTHQKSFSMRPSGFVEDVRIPGALRVVNSYGVAVFGLIQSTTINEWVFCSSVGHWDRSHHRQMIEGTKEYKGNPRLLGYCVYDVDELGAAVWNRAQIHSEFAAKDFDGSAFFSAKVRYTKSIERKEIYGSKHHEPELKITPNVYSELLFLKEQRFRVENEYRMVLRMKAPYFAPDGAGPIFFSSSEIRSSMVEIGTF